MRLSLSTFQDPQRSPHRLSTTNGSIEFPALTSLPFRLPRRKRVMRKRKLLQKRQLASMKGMSKQVQVICSVALSAVSTLVTPATASAQTGLDFFAAATCDPPYSPELATRLHDAAEKSFKPDMSIVGAAVYHLPKPIERNGIATQDIVFAAGLVGVLIEGHVAARIAARYKLRRETTDMLGASSLGFSRQLPDNLQTRKDKGLISLVAREGPTLVGKTLLACEFDSNDDLDRLEALKRYLPFRKAAPANDESRPRQ